MAALRLVPPLVDAATPRASARREALRLRGDGSTAAGADEVVREALVADSLDRFGIVAKKDLYPSQLSGGQQQLVGVARAVVASPRVILADEPTGNLHSAQGREIMELFRSLNEQGTTIIQVTHSEVNAQYGHRIVQLKDGWLVSDERTVRGAA